MSNIKKVHHSYEALLAQKIETLQEEAPLNPEARKLLHRLNQLTAEAKSIRDLPSHKIATSSSRTLELKLALT